MIVCWSVKGGSGTTVVSASLALSLAQRNASPVRIIDFCGDIPAALGIAEPSAIGITDWLVAENRPPIESLQIPVTNNVSVIPRGTEINDSFALTAEQCNDVTAGVDSSHELTVVDAGDGQTSLLAQYATMSLLVIRPCYLALRKASRLRVKPHGVVLVSEPGRSLGKRDVESVLSVPVIAEIPLDPSISRCVDAGLLASRLPGSISQHLAHVA